jgi:hypothetical protein
MTYNTAMIQWRVLQQSPTYLQQRLQEAPQLVHTKATELSLVQPAGMPPAT